MLRKIRYVSCKNVHKRQRKRYDNVLILVAPYYVTDHYQEGYYTYSLGRFFNIWREGLCADKNGDLMNNKHFIHKAFRIFVVNSIISSAGVSLCTFVDAIILGNAFGEAGLSVLVVTLPVYMIYNLIGFAFGMGGSLKVSKAIAAEDEEGIKVHFTQAVLFALAIGIVLAVIGTLLLPQIIRLTGGADLSSVVDYMRPVVLTAPVFILAPVFSLIIRSDADPSLSTIGITTSFVVNLALDLVLIYILRWGMLGAALAMVLGQLSAVIVYMVHFFKKHNHLKLCKVSFNPKDAFSLFKGGFAIASSYVYQGIALVVINNIISMKAGETGLATYNILFNVFMFAYAVFDGISLALTPLVATFAGEKDTEGVYSTMRLSLITSFVLGAVCTLVLLLFAEPLALLFGVKEDLPLVALTIRLLSLAVVQTCFNCVVASFYQTTNRNLFAGVIYLMRGVALLILFSAFFIPMYGVMGTALAMIASESVTTVLLLLMATVIKKKRGYRNLLLLNEPVIQKDYLYETTLFSDLSQLQSCVSEINAFCERLSIDKKTAYYINLTIEELASNIISFGFNDKKLHYISIKIVLIETDIYIRMRDDSIRYNPFEESKELDKAMDYLGVSIIRAKAKFFSYNRTLVFNNLLIIL